MRAPALAATLSLAALLAFPAEATREGFAFDLSIAGLPIGSAHLSAARDEGRYVLEGTADFGFLFWGGRGVATAEGVDAGGALRPSSYRLSYQGATRPGHVEIAFEDDRVARWEREPETPPQYREGRVAVTDAHLEGVLDPLSAVVIPAAPDADPAALCRRVMPVFNGVTRFDLALTGARAVDGGGVACAARYVPVAGHRPDSASVRRMNDPDALAVSLSPMGDGLWGPSRIAVATRFGTFEAVRR